MTKAKRAVAHAFDAHIGVMVRRAREAQGWTQGELAAAVGVTYQQIQKYESGVIRVSAGRLMQLCQTLEVPIAYFFADLIEQVEEEGTLIGVTVDLTKLTSAKVSAVHRVVTASDSDAETVDALLARLKNTYS
jgi:transcriptional regulator with XRE-family HTH domain